MMKKLTILLLGITLFLLACDIDESTGPGVEPDPEPVNALVINEFMSHNDLAWAGPNNDYPDWIELYNGTDVTIDIAGMYLTDNLDELEMSMIPADAPELTTIEPGAFLVLIADGSPENGTLHLDLKLSDNEDFALVDTDGSTILDQRNTAVLPDDVTEGRVPDGYTSWEVLDVPTPGSSNGGDGPEPQGAILLINEFMASNDYSITDANGDHEDWIELYNDGDEAIDIGGMYMTDDLTDLTNSMIPTDDPDLTTIQPGEYLIIWADKEPEQGTLHLADVKLSGSGEQIGLIDVDGVTIIDSLTYGEQTTDVSYGRTTDGAATWEYFGAGYATMPTPGAANGSGDAPSAMLYINEFLASNDTGATDENGDYDDWIEIYNAGNTPKDIGGMYFTDDLTNLTNSMIPTDDPDATTIAPGGYLIIWADKEPEQGPLHLDDVKLSGDGEEIGMIDVDGETIIDSYTFGAQTTDVSEGRMPDGGETWEFFANPTPGATNE
jgi:hypothetical protein